MKSINPNIAKVHRPDFNFDALCQGIEKRQAAYLGQGITLVESRSEQDKPKAKDLLNWATQHAQPSIRIGITGVPGAGKSTFIESFGCYLTEQGLSVAVLAIDPSSQISHGSILGDKTRMEKLSVHTNAFIRPSAAGQTLGGIAQKTRETISICEAAGFDVILIETVGVGQSETLVRQMVDFFVLMQLAGGGDELQGIKRGIMEMADAILINKSDGENIQKAQMARMEYLRALSLFAPSESGWKPKVLPISALKFKGIAECWQLIKAYQEKTTASGFFSSYRQEQNIRWLNKSVEEQILSWIVGHEEVKKSLHQLESQVKNQKLDPFLAADSLVSEIKGFGFATHNSSKSS